MNEQERLAARLNAGFDSLDEWFKAIVFLVASCVAILVVLGVAGGIYYGIKNDDAVRVFSLSKCTAAGYSATTCQAASQNSVAPGNEENADFRRSEDYSCAQAMGAGITSADCAKFRDFWVRSDK